MPAKSKSQQRLFGMVTAYKDGKLKLDDLPVSLAKKIKSIADGSKRKTGDKRKKTKGITKKAAKDIASTKHKGKPERVKESNVLKFEDFLNEGKTINQTPKEIADEVYAILINAQVGDKPVKEKWLINTLKGFGYDEESDDGKLFDDVASELVNKGMDIELDESLVKESSEAYPSDDLKANFRSWEQDCDNEEDANKLLSILIDRHPDEDEEELKSLAYDWVGYEDEDDERNYLRDTVYHGRSEILDELIDDFDTSRNPDELYDDVEESINIKKVLKFNDTNKGKKHHSQIKEENKELNKEFIQENIIHFSKFEKITENLNKFVGTPGDTEIWYEKETNFDPWEFREEMYSEETEHDMSYTKRNGPRIDPKNLEKTHALLGTVGETDLNDIYDMMNRWGVGELSNKFLDEKGVRHTSMSIGDIIKIGDTVYFVDGRGFKDITNE